MMKLLNSILVILLFFTCNCYAQLYNGYKIAPWSLMEYSGGLGVQGMYGASKLFIDDVLVNKVEQSAFSGMANFESKSYIYHPNLVVLDIGASYNPGASNYAQLVTRTDYSTFLDSKLLNISAYFLKQKRLSFSTRVNLSESYVNIENITKSKTNNKNFGGSVRYLNNFAPINIAYDFRKSNVRDLNTDRVMDQRGSSFQLYASKSWEWYANTNLRIVHRKDNNSLANDKRFITETDRISLTNNINFTRNKKYTLFSRIEYFNQNTNLSSSNLNFFERLNMTFYDDLKLATTSNYMIRGLAGNGSKRFMINSNLSHKLYKSLFSRVMVAYNNTNSSFIKRTQYQYGFSTRYTKKIPLDGTLRLNYTYNKRINNTDGLSNILEVNQEEYILTDDEVVFLQNSNIIRNSIIVQNNTGTLIYEENIDYVLYDTGTFIEIQRLSGGLIENNSTVLISYKSNQTGDYTINSNNNFFSAGVNLFKGILNFNYNYNNQNFDNSSDITYEIDNYYKRTGYDGSINYKFFSGNVRYEKQLSGLVNYKRLSYILNLHGNYRRYIYNLDYKVDDYLVIQEEGRKEKRVYLTGMVAYSFSPRSKLNFMLGYNNRTVNGSGRKWITSRISYVSAIGALNLAASINYNDSNSSGSRQNFIGGNISIIRVF